MQQFTYPDADPSINQQKLQSQLFNNQNQYLAIQQTKKYILLQHPQTNMRCLTQINYQQQNHQLDQSNNLNNSTLLKDSGFEIQKLYLSGILGMFILWTLLSALLCFILIIMFISNPKEFKFNYTYCIIACILILILLIKLGQMEKLRHDTLTTLIYFGSIISYTFIFFFILASFSSSLHQEVPDFLFILIFLIVPLLGNFIVTIIILIYILIGTKVRFYKVFICEFLYIFPIAIIYAPLLLSLVFLLPYTYLLINVLQQIQSGRFNLRKDQVLSGTMAAYYGIFMPFDYFD